MTTRHLEILVEEPSMEAFLRALLPRLLPIDRTFEIHAFQGKTDLLTNLQSRLRGYAEWLPKSWRIIVVVDRDDDDCRHLKQQLDTIASDTGLLPRPQAAGQSWQLINRIAIEELEAWYFGDWLAVCRVYPRLPVNIPMKSGFRNPDAIQGGTWEAFERILQKHGYFTTGLRKIEAARAIGNLIDPIHNRSNSYRKFQAALVEAMA
jgi:hypothetical protein